MYKNAKAADQYCATEKLVYRLRFVALDIEVVNKLLQNMLFDSGTLCTSLIRLRVLHLVQNIIYLFSALKYEF